MIVRMRLLPLWERLEIDREFPVLVPMLVKKGLDCQDAVALAHNVALLGRAAVLEPPAQTSKELMQRLSAAQIAQLCEEYVVRECSSLGVKSVWEEDVE